MLHQIKEDNISGKERELYNSLKGYFDVVRRCKLKRCQKIYGVDLKVTDNGVCPACMKEMWRNKRLWRTK